MTTARIAVPSAPGRKARTEQECRDFEEQIKLREAAIIRQREPWSAINSFVSRNGGWITSSPAERPVRLEVPLYSELPQRLFDLGHDLHPADGMSGERIEGGKILQTLRFQFELR